MIGRMHLLPRIIAHRGACGYRPEHTASAYELAFALGADAVEPDIVPTRDGVLVLRHENEISGTTDVASHPEFASRRTSKEVDGRVVEGWFTEDFTWDELATLRARERLPTLRPASASFDGRFSILRLSELFELVDRGSEEHDRAFAVVAEFKHATYFDALGLPLDELFAAELDAAGWAAEADRLVLESFELGILDRLARRGVPGQRVFLLESKGKPFDGVAALGEAAPSYVDYLTEQGLLRLASAPGFERVHGVSVDVSRLLCGDAGRIDGLDVGGSGGDGDRADVGAGRQASILVDLAHSAGLSIFCWTLRPENRFLAAPYRRGADKSAYGDWFGQFVAIMATGVDAVFADHPDLALEARATL